MGPKRGSIRKEGPKKENSIKNFSIEEPINSDTWKCVVVMAVERTSSDDFILKEFLEEASTGRRQEVKVIHFESFVMKILNDFANGELSFNYIYLLNFATVFQEAAEYVKKKEEIPIQVLVKVIKSLLFFLKEESLTKIEKKAMGPPDPIKVMGDRPNDPGGSILNAQKNKLEEKGKKAGAQQEGLKVRPPSVTKAETMLLKRGEEAKEDQRIDDSPINGYFNLYVLLTGFYHPDLPLELIKANVPLHGFLCIDTSLSAMKRVSNMSYGKYQRKVSGDNTKTIQNFWDSFLRILWDPDVNWFFRDTIFQVYVPRKLLCDKKNMKEFIYKEISFLLYDMSDFKRQHEHYLKNLKLWNVEENEKLEIKEKYIFELDDLPSECTTVPVVLQCVMDMICGEDRKSRGGKSVSFDSIDVESSESLKSEMNKSPSNVGKFGSTFLFPVFSQIFQEGGKTNAFEIYSKSKELDIKYDLYENYSCPSSDKTNKDDETSEATCRIQWFRNCGKNMEEALRSNDGIFRSYWRRLIKPQSNTAIVVDYSLYLLLMTKVICPYELTSITSVKPFCQSLTTKKNSTFELIENMEVEIRKPHFTVTEGSRSILRSTPFNMKNSSRNFFCPSQYKIVTPEKVKASSALEFHVMPKLKTELSYISDICIPYEFLQDVDVYENLNGFIGDYLFSNVNGFYFIEEMNKQKLLSKELQFSEKYNCYDYTYSVLIDSIFVVLHNRKDSDNMRHETFNQGLKTKVGLRDFFEYVLEDEAPWFINQEEIYKSEMTLITNKTSGNSLIKETKDSDFWLENSIKYQERLKMKTESVKNLKDDKNEKNKFDKGDVTQKTDKDVKNKKKGIDREVRKEVSKEIDEITMDLSISKTEEEYYFEGYDISGMALQFSGLKTCYHVDDCSIDVDLMEKLYGNQDLGIHINQGGHTLHLYSYVCPEPHLMQPYTCHLTYKNGIILAFSRRIVVNYKEVEEVRPRKVSISRSKKSSSDVLSNEGVRFVKVPQVEKDEQFLYDMKLSLPNSLTVEVVKRSAKPCYIKQKYIRPDGYSGRREEENSRLFLYNGDVVKIMSDGTVYIFKINASIISTSMECLKDDITIERFEGEDERQTYKMRFSKYELTTSIGEYKKIDNGTVVSYEKLSVFQNTDIQTNTAFFRRKDGTNYVMKNDGSLCVQFQDGTKIFSSVFFKEEGNQENGGIEEEYESEIDEEIAGEMDNSSEFVFIYMEIIIEHPDYATLIFNQQTQKWKIRLPFESTITVEPDGNYSVVIDTQTEFRISGNMIQMDRLSFDNKLQCAVTADLTVFENRESEACYCKMEDYTGKRFVVEANSSCYLEEMDSDATTKSDKVEEYSELQSENSVEVAVSCDSLQKQNIGSKLSRDKKYFMVRRDISGFEVLHYDDVQQILNNIQKGSVVFTQDIPGTDNLRCFVLITPAPNQKNKDRKWEVETILPDPKFVPRPSPPITSTLYCSPPSWTHPFPKRKNKFKMPSVLTCRAFMETKRTDCCPQYVPLDCGFCEMTEIPEVRLTKIEPGIRNIQNYMMKLGNDDQDILKEMYSLMVWDILNEKKKLKPVNTEKLEKYLALSKYYVEMQEYHKKCIRYHLVPNYFEHPAGMSWLILNSLIDKLVLPCRVDQKPSKKPQGVELWPSQSISVLSDEEIEYNLSWRSEQSFSDLSYRTGISTKTAPSVLKGGLCTCKIKPIRKTISAPIYKMKDIEQEQDLEASQTRVCDFKEANLIELGRKKLEESEIITLEDLIFLGLI